MRITVSQLRRIIREEVAAVRGGAQHEIGAITFDEMEKFAEEWAGQVGVSRYKNKMSLAKKAFKADFEEQFGEGPDEEILAIWHDAFVAEVAVGPLGRPLSPGKVDRYIDSEIERVSVPGSGGGLKEFILAASGEVVEAPDVKAARKVLKRNNSRYTSKELDTVMSMEDYRASGGDARWSSGA